MEKSIKILIVDDEKSIIDILNAYLTRSGYIVESSPNIKQAVEYLDNGDVNIVLCDIILQQEDGYELLEYVKKNFSDIAVLMMTGHVETHSIKTSLQKGADDYISKPIKFSELSNVINKVTWKYASKWQVTSASPAG